MLVCFQVTATRVNVSVLSSHRWLKQRYNQTDEKNVQTEIFNANKWRFSNQSDLEQQSKIRLEQKIAKGPEVHQSQILEFDPYLTVNVVGRSDLFNKGSTFAGRF